MRKKDNDFIEIYNNSKTEATISSSDIENINMSRSGNTLVVYGKQNVYVVNNMLSESIVMTTIPIKEGVSPVVTISDDGKLIHVYSSDVGGKLYVLESDGKYTERELPTNIVSVLQFAKQVGFSKNNDKLYIINHIDSSKEGWIVLNNFNDAVFVGTPILGGGTNTKYSYFESDFFIYVSPISTARERITKTQYDFSNSEPLLTITRELTQTHPQYNNYNKYSSKLRSAILSIRFDNERWFGVKNTTFRTINNNPTYVGIDTVNNLGETDEDITGFNLIQDDLLVVYKDNKLWAITPQTYEDDTGVMLYDYAYQETKNTVGNNAIGASIVSAYSEIPLQISYDGVYGLKQLANVYASDRISELLSEAITSKWLTEDKTVIRNMLTLNRLYWTYFILPYDKLIKYENGIKKETTNITKIYLLDNRTASWFYWELPIKVNNAFVKNDVVQLTDDEGNLYNLTSDDIVTDYSTEYYDDGKKIINWYWKSQILPLGTINYSKKLIDTTFIFTDTDANDEYGLNYTYYAYRRGVSKTNETTISNTLNYVQSTTKKTLIPRINFVQLELSNIVDDLNNNKLRLVGLGLKYVLLEGLL